VNRVGRVISTAIQFIDGFTKPSKAVCDSMKKMGNEAIKAGKDIQKAGKTITAAGSTLTKSVTLPIVGVAAAAVKTAADFESAMSKVAAVSGATGDDFKALTEKAKEMGAKTKFSASESAEAMNYMAMAGWKTEEMLGGIEGIMNLAAASGEDLALTSDIVTDALTAFGKTAKDSGTLADILAAASSNSNTNVAMMGETFKYCAPIAGALGYSMEDTAENIGYMANAGIKASNAGTAMRKIMTGLQGTVEFAGKSFGKMKVETTNADGSMRAFNDIIKDCRTAFSHMSESERAANAEMLAGKTGMSGFLAIMNAAPADIEKLNGAIINSAGAAEEMAAIMNDNLNGQIVILKSAIEGIAITIGNKLLPYIKKTVSWFQTAAEYINNLSDAQVNNIMKWAGIAAAVGPAIMIFGKVVTTVGAAVKTFGTITKTIANFGGIVGMLTSPAGIVIGVLVAIAVAAVLIIKNWDKVKAFLSSVGEWFKNAFEKAGFSVEGFKNKFTSISNVVGEIVGKITGFCKSIAAAFKKDFAGSIGEGVPEINEGFQAIAGAAAGAFNGITTAIDKGLKVFSALLDFFAGGFMGNWNSAADGFKDSLKNIFPADIAEGLIKAFDKALPVITAVAEGVKASIGGMVEDAKKIFESFKTALSGVGTFFKGVFTGDMETALGGFKTACSGILDTIGNIFKGRINAVKNFVLTAFSNFLPENTMNKIAAAFDTVTAAWDIAISAAKRLVEEFVQAIKPLIDNVKTVLSGISQFIKGVFTGDWKGALNGLKTIAGGALSGLVNIIKVPFTMISNLVKGAINSFKSMNIIKTIFTAVGTAIKNVLTKCGVDMNKFSANINNIKTRVSSIINNLKTIFSTVFGAIGKVVRATATVVANIFGKRISNTCSTAGAVITAFKAVASAAFSFISGTIQKAMAVIVPVVKVAFSAISGGISAAVQSITEIISGLMTVFDGITTFISGVFTGNWSQAWEGVKTIFSGVFESLVALCKTPINAVIGIINGAISGINNLGITVPDWVPLIGGNAFSINIPTIPMLYKGTDNWRGGTAMIHDRGGEIVDLPRGTRVYPHDKSVSMARQEGAAASGSGSINITIQKLADKIEVRNDKDIDRIAEALALKLKKVALNTGAI